MEFFANILLVRAVVLGENLSRIESAKQMNINGMIPVNILGANLKAQL